MNTEKNQINPFEYTYPPNTMVEIPAAALLNILFFCEKVIESQPTKAVPYVYPTNVKEKKDKEGNLLSVDVEWKPFPTVEPFLNTINNPIRIATEVTIISEQVSYSFMNLHMQNIEKGIAKKLGELTKEQEDAEIEKKLKIKK
jgi:hypothetical protein